MGSFTYHNEAARLDRPDVVETLLAPGEGLQRRDLPRQAVVKGQLGLVKVPLEKGADVNARNAFGSTPLHEAALKGQMEVTRVLLEHGANVRRGTRMARRRYMMLPSAGRLASSGRFCLTRERRSMSRRVSEPCRLYQATAWGRLETVDLLVRKGADTSIARGKASVRCKRRSPTSTRWLSSGCGINGPSIFSLKNVPGGWAKRPAVPGLLSD
jgi:hypothetical protein